MEVKLPMLAHGHDLAQRFDARCQPVGSRTPIVSPALVKLMMYLYFPTNEYFSAADVLLTIVTNESSIVSDDCMSLDGIRGASIPLNDPGVLRSSIRFYREDHSHKAHLDPMNAAIPV